MPVELSWPALGALGLGLLAAALAAGWVRAHRQRRALAERLAFHEAILETIPYPMYVKDADGRFTGCNRAYERAFGVSRESLRGRTTLALPHLSAAERQRLDEEEAAVLRETGRRASELPITDADGKARTMRCSINAVTLAGGHPRGLVGLFVEIPEQRQQHEAPLPPLAVPAPAGLVDRPLVRVALERLRAALAQLDPAASTDALDDLRATRLPATMEGDVARLCALVEAYEYAEASALAARLLERLPPSPRS